MDPIGKLLLIQFITARKQSLRRLCFYTCLSVHRGGVPGQALFKPPGTRYTPRQIHTPGTRYTSLGPGQVTPQTRYTHPNPPGTRYTPPGIRYTPTGPGTPNPQWDQVHPPGIRYTPPGPGTPNPQWDQVHLPPLPREQCVLGDMGNKRALRILLKCILVF